MGATGGLIRSRWRSFARRPTRTKTLPGLVLAVACTCLAAACTGTAGHPNAVASKPITGTASTAPAAAGSSRASTAPSPVNSAQPTTQPAPEPTSAQQVAAPLPTCPVSWLHGAIGTPTGAAGTFYYPLQFTNTSNSPCTLYGYPGVSVVTGPSGHQLGQAATRIPTFGPRLVILKPGQTAHAAVQLPDPGSFPPRVCRPVTVRWLRVYPPDAVAPLFIKVTTTVIPMKICTGQNLHTAIPIGIFVVLPGQ